MYSFANATIGTRQALLMTACIYALAVSNALALDMGARLRTPPDALLTIDQNRTAVIDRIVATWGEQLAKSSAGVDAAQLREMLEGMRADHLLAASLVGTLDGLRDVIAKTLATTAEVTPSRVQSKSLGDAADDLVYTPITPCRILDTRSGTAPPYNSVVVGGSAFPVAANLPSFAPQGGAASNCNLPPSFQAIAVVLTVLNPNFDAYLAASNSNNFATITQSVVMNFSANRGLANTAIVPVDGAIKFYLGLPLQVTTHVIADAVGYFAAPVATALQCTQIASASTPIAVSSDTLVALPNCAVGYTRTGSNCSGTANVPGAYLLETNATGCLFRNLSSVSPYNAVAASTCCRIPGR